MFEQTTATFDRRHRSFFGDDDARQVWALDTARRQIVHLPDGAVDDDVRSACRRGRLRCPVTDCPDPRLIAKGGTRRRHHFAHKVAHTRHDSAAVLRVEAVAMLAAWAQRYRGAHVSTRHDGELGVVAIRSARSGRTAELAVTYDPCHEPTPAPLAPSRQLLVGHTRSLLLPRAAHAQLPDAWCCGQPRLVGQLIDAHDVALAVNPQRLLVGTLISTRFAELAGLAPNDSTAYPIICLIADIHACRLDEHGELTTPAVRALRAWQTSHKTPRLVLSRKRRATPTRNPPPPRSTTERSPTADLGLPIAGDAPRGRSDINRVILGGPLSGEAQAALASDGGTCWRLPVALDPNRPTNSIDVFVERPAGGAPPAPGSAVVVHGQLASRPSDGIAIIADTLELYAHGG